MVAVPGVTATTDPVALTVATVAFEVVHATARPVSVLPPASRAVAVAAATSPTMSAPFTDTDTDFTGTGMTVMTTAAFSVPTEPVMVAVPGLIPVSTPADVMDRTVASDVLQVTAALIGFPAGFFTTADTEVEVPTGIVPAVGGVISTDAGVLVVVLVIVVSTGDVISPLLHARVNNPNESAAFLIIVRISTTAIA